MSAHQIFRKCEHPKFVHGRLHNCGRCVACLGRRNAEILTRVRNDMRTCGQKWLNDRVNCDILDTVSYKLTARFVHITYSDEKLPENGSLVKSHLQKYLKRVRQRIYEATGIKNIASINAGEYGEKKGRPHYHIFMWRLPEFQGLFNILVDCWKESEEGRDCRIVVSRIAGDAMKAVAYCVGYSTKGSRKYDRKSGESADDYKLRTGREPPFVTWSKGIGLDWLLENEENLLRNGFIITERGKRLAFPRYYRKKLLEKQSFESFRDEFKKQCEMWREYDVHFSATDEEIGFLYAERRARMRTQEEFQREYSKVRYRTIKLIEGLCSGIPDYYFTHAWKVDILASFVNDNFFSWSDEDKKKALSKYMARFREYRRPGYMEAYWFWLTFYFSDLPDRIRRHVIMEIPYDDEIFEATDILVSFQGFLQDYEVACQEYDKKIADSVRQQGLNYRRLKEMMNTNRYKDTACYDEVIDRENDLPRLVVRKRKRSRKNVLDY